MTKRDSTSPEKRLPLTMPLDRPIRLAVLISGSGTTFVNLVDAQKKGQLAAEFPLVIASRPDCQGIAKAGSAAVPVRVISRKSYASTQQFSDAIFAECRAVTADLVICAGFLALIEIPGDFKDRVMNIHPSLIPAFSGKGYFGEHVHRAAIERGAKVSGCTVHFVDNQYDHGPIILQRTVVVNDDDTPHDLAARVFQEECVAYPEAIRLYAAGRLAICGHRVHIRELSE